MCVCIGWPRLCEIRRTPQISNPQNCIAEPLGRLQVASSHVEQKTERKFQGSCKMTIIKLHTTLRRLPKPRALSANVKDMLAAMKNSRNKKSTQLTASLGIAALPWTPKRESGLGIKV